MKWSVVAPFFRSNQKNVWIDDFVESDSHQFQKIVPSSRFRTTSWHSKASPITSLTEWIEHFHQSSKSLSVGSSGVITVFPQLPTTVGFLKKVRRSNTPLIAYCFNVGKLYTGLRQRAASIALREVDKFVVHSRREISTVSHWLDLDEKKFEFLPLQSANIPFYSDEQEKMPFLLSLGSANRDYKTLFKAISGLNIRVVIVASKAALSNLKLPRNVEVLCNLTRQECHILAQKARVNVVPLGDTPTASGQVTVVEAMTMGCAIIASRCCGTEDYIINRETGFLTQPDDVNALRENILELWDSDHVRRKIRKSASLYAKKEFSDQAAGINLRNLLDRYK